MSEVKDAKPSKSKPMPSAAEILKALGPSAEFASVEGNAVKIVYPSLDVYNASVSRDVEAIRAIAPQPDALESVACPHDPKLEELSRVANAQPLPAYQPNPLGAQRLVVVIN